MNTFIPIYLSLCVEEVKDITLSFRVTCVLEFSFIAKVALSRKLYWLELLLQLQIFISKFFSPETMYAMTFSDLNNFFFRFLSRLLCTCLVII